MALKVSGRNVDIGQALRSRIESTVPRTHGNSQTFVIGLQNANHGAPNIVYLCKDGHTAWVDPALIEAGHA